MLLGTCVFVVMSAHKCLTFSSEHPLQSDAHLKDKLETQGNVTGSLEIVENQSAWPAVLGALTAVFSTGLLIALAIRYRFFRWCLARNNHALLPEEETQSQNESLEGEMPVRGMRGRMIHTGESSDDGEEEEDDDGFIEDNYIPASVRKEAEEEENLQDEDEEDSDDELVNDLH